MANYISSYVIDYNDSKQLKYGVINLCDNTTYYGSTTWSVIDNGGIIGLTVDGSTHDGVVLSSNDDKYLVITNTYTGKNADPVIIVKASSDLVSCDSNNTCTITLKRACYMQPVMFEVKINDDSKGYATSITGNVNLHFGVITDNGSLGIGFGGKLEINSATNSTNDYITDSPINIPSNCNLNNTNGKGIYFHFNDITLNISLNNNVQNVSVSGEAKYKFDGATYTTLDSISSESYTYTSTSNSITITGCDYTTTKLNGLMDGLKTLYIKHIINLKYDEVQYKWYTMLPSQDTWSESTEFTITMSENDSHLGVGGIVSISHCTGSDRSDCDSASTFTFKNDNTITLNKTWGLSDLRYDNTDDNVILLYTHKELYDNLLVADTGTYTISGEIVSSLDGSSFPVTVNYEVIEKTRIIEINIGLICNLEYVTKYCDGGIGSPIDLEWIIKFDNLNLSDISNNYAAMPNGLNEVVGSMIEIKGYDGIRPSGFILISIPHGPILNKSSFTISVSNDGLGRKTFNGTSNNCPSGGIYYTYDNNDLSLEVPFEVTNDSDEINIDISIA